MNTVSFLTRPYGIDLKNPAGYDVIIPNKHPSRDLVVFLDFLPEKILEVHAFEHDRDVTLDGYTNTSHTWIELRQWLCSNILTGQVKILNNEYVIFEFSTDATLFKLTWS